MAAIEDGMYQPAMKARMAELERERAEIAARLAEAPQSLPDVHPGIAEIYKRKVARLNETLKDPDTRLDASSDIRSPEDRKRVVDGKSWCVRVRLGGRRMIKK